MQTLSNYGQFEGYKILRQLGSGFHGEVVLAERENKKYAVKLFKTKPSGFEDWKHEIDILKQLEHPNIVKLVDFKEKGIYKTETKQQIQRAAIILQHVEGGELMYYLLVGRFSEGATRTYFRIILDAIAHMHSQGIAHRDVKPQNILLDQKFNLKIIDFGFSTYLNRGMLRTRCGTEAYMAPEVVDKCYDGKAADLFASGIILFLLYTGIPPFERANEISDQYYKALYDKKYKKFWLGHSSRLPEGYLTDDFKDLIEKMLCHDPNQRLSLEQIINHDWMKKDSLLLNEVYEEFTLRKKRIDEIRKMQIQFQKKRREEMKKFQEMKDIAGPKKTRSSSDRDLFLTYWRNVKISYEQLKPTLQIDDCDMVINESPQNFIAMIQYHLQNRRDNLIVSSEELEDYFVVVNSPQQEIAIKVVNSFLENLQPRVAKIYIQLFSTQDKKLRVRFQKDEEGDEILALKLVDLIKNGFYFLKN